MFSYKPLISVVIPAFERVSLTNRAIESVLSQTYSDFEIILVNDGSAEDYSSVQTRLAQTGHNFIQLEKNRGVSAARNEGARLAKGDWLCFLDADDCWHEDKLKKQVGLHRDSPNCRASQCEEKWIRSGSLVEKRREQSTPSGDIFKDCLTRCCVSASAIMIERSLFSSLGGFDERLRVCEDYDLWLRLSKDHEVLLLEEELTIKYREKSGHLSQSVPALDRFRLFALLKLLTEGTFGSERLELVLQEVKRKAGILEKGSIKRGDKEAHLYTEAFRLADQGTADPVAWKSFFNVYEGGVLNTESTENTERKRRGVSLFNICLC